MHTYILNHSTTIPLSNPTLRWPPTTGTANNIKAGRPQHKKMLGLHLLNLPNNKTFPPRPHVHQQGGQG